MKPRWTSLAAGLWTGEAGSLDWNRIAQSALDRDLLGVSDLKLIRLLAERAGRPGDGALKGVLAALAASVRTGGLRIPAEQGPLEARLEAFLRGLHAGPILLRAPEAGTDSAGLADPDLPALAAALAGAFREAMAAGEYAAVLGSSPEDFKPLIHSGRSLYFQKHLAAEALAGTRLAALLSAPDRPLEPEAVRTLLDTVLLRFPLRIGRDSGSPAMEFRGGQKLALALGLRKRLLVASGGPGTGKTSLVANLLRALVRLPGNPERPLRIRLAAPTGRAAQRLTESLRAGLGSIGHKALPAATVDSPDAMEASLDGSLAALAGETLHRLLRYEPGRGEFHHRRGRPVPADVIVVDEVSMVDIFTLARLTDALEDGATLILLGDMDQLPSVEAGAVLADLLPGDGAASLSPALRAWMADCLPGETLPPAAPPVMEAGGESPVPAPLRDHLVLLDRSHRSEAGILDVTRKINVMDGEGALAAMAGAAAFGSAAPPWTVTFLEQGRKITPGGGCRMLIPPGDMAGSGAPPEADFRPGLPAWLESWADFHYRGLAQDPARNPGRVLAAPRPSSYAALIARLAAAAPADLGLSDLAAPGNPGRPAAADLGEAFAILDQARILTFTRKGWHGSDSVNRRLRESLEPEWDPHGPHTSLGLEGFHGAPIMIQENDYARDLFNGEVGILLRLRGSYYALFRKEGGYRAHPAAALPRHELAFASTVHKAQGSEYDQVLIILPEAGNRLLYKETLYTAITRARHFAGIYGPREVFLEAVARKVVRESGLREYLSSISIP